MKIEEILENWKSDSKLDQTQLSSEGLRISSLHHKYITWLASERISLKKSEIEFKKLRKEKIEFYTQGPTKEHIALGWEFPSCGKILKKEVDTYLDSDVDLCEIESKIAICQEKVNILTSILQALHQRSYTLRTVVDNNKFLAGIG